VRACAGPSEPENAFVAGDLAGIEGLLPSTRTDCVFALEGVVICLELPVWISTVGTCGVASFGVIGRCVAEF